MTAPTPPSQTGEELERILARDVLGRTMTMVENCYLNMTTDEFEEFLQRYSKAQHKYELGDNCCDGCNGIWDAAQQINERFQRAIGEVEPLTEFEVDGHDYVKGPRNALRVEARRRWEEGKTAQPAPVSTEFSPYDFTH